MIRKTTLFVLIFLSSLLLFAQKEAEVMKKSRDYITAKKYLSAFKILQDLDPENKKPDIFLLKEEIVLNYYITSIMHQMFSLRDLGKNEKLEDYRGKEGSSEMFNFAVDEILAKLIKDNPKNYKLYRGLGDYYFEVQQVYGDNWVKHDLDLFQMIKDCYQTAIDHQEGTYLSYYVMGYASASGEKYKEAIPYLLKSIELKKDFADAEYNLAYAYLFTGESDKALPYAIHAFALYTDSLNKADASRMLGAVYSELKNDSAAIKNYELSNDLDPGNEQTIGPLLFEYLKTGNPKAKPMINSVFESDPEDPNVYNGLNRLYETAGKTDDLITYYKEKEVEYKDSAMITGNINFFIGKIYLTKDKKKAMEYFNRSKTEFSKILNSDAEVFKALDIMMKEAAE